MANNDEGKPLYLAMFKLIKYLYSIIKQYPKEYKYTLGEDILKLAWTSFDFIIEANGIPNNQKGLYISKAIITFNKLKYRIRIGNENKMISHKQYANLITQFDEINKMLTGWFIWSKKF